MTQKERLEDLTGEKMPEPTPQEHYRQPLEGTPFWIIGTRLNGYNLIMGKYKLNKDPFGFGIFDQGTIENEALDWLELNQWNTILSIIIAVTTDIINKQNQN